MNLSNYATKFLAPKAKAFEKTTKNPLLAQEKILSEILVRNRKTVYGEKYHFSRIKSSREYRASVPLTDCGLLRPYITRMINGEKRVLTADSPILYSVTSGSSGKPKFVPITKYSRRKKAEVLSLWAHYIFRDYPNIVRGKILAIVSPEVDSYTNSGVPYGAESGHGYKNLSRIIRRLYSLPYETFEIRDYDARYYSILRIALEDDITTIATMTPSTIVLLLQKLEEFKSDIIDDIEKGTLKASLQIDDNLRKVLEKPLRPNPERAGELRRIIREKKALLPKYIWPNIQLIECWKGGTVGMYLREFPRYFGNAPVRDFGYFSSEARCSIPITNEGAGGILAISGNFYEFIAKEKIGNKETQSLLCNELKEGKEYFIVLTTPGGLYRYNIDDLIRVNGFFNKTPIIEFVQRGLNVTSITGEKLYESQVVEAVRRAIDKSLVSLEFFTALIEPLKIPRYAFLVEFSKKPPDGKEKEFLASVDEELCKLNEEYEFNRKSQELEKPVLKVVCPGEFVRFRAKKVKEGMHDGQFKVPNLSSDMNFQKNFTIEEEIAID